MSEPNPNSAQNSAPSLSLLQMNDIFFYIMFSGHTDFVGMLVLESMANVRESYVRFAEVAPVLDHAEQLVRSQRITHEHCVVLFFFLLSIDSRMRHWLLSAYEPEELKEIRQNALLKNIELVPGGSASLPKNCPCPFLGQHVALRALAPHRAVPILSSIASEAFFVSEDQSECSLSRIHDKLRRLVLFA